MCWGNWNHASHSNNKDYKALRESAHAVYYLKNDLHATIYQKPHTFSKWEEVALYSFLENNELPRSNSDQEPRLKDKTLIRVSQN